MLPVQIATGAKLGAAAAFVIGILAALGAGLWSLYVFKRVSSAAGTMLAYWLTVADDGERLKALEATMKADMDEAVGSRATLSLGSASAAAFLVGCALAGWGMFSHERADRHWAAGRTSKSSGPSDVAHCSGSRRIKRCKSTFLRFALRL
jgi:hypothetical protein